MRDNDGFTPLALTKRVKLKPGLAKFRDMFRDLSAQREYNEAGVQSIQIDQIEAYLNIICENRPEHRKVYLRLMLDLDTVFMEHVREKMRRQSPSS